MQKFTSFYSILQYFRITNIIIGNFKYKYFKIEIFLNYFSNLTSKENLFF